MSYSSERTSWTREQAGQEPEDEDKSGRYRKELGLVESHGLLGRRRKGKSKGTHYPEVEDVRRPKASSWVQAGLAACLLYSRLGGKR